MVNNYKLINLGVNIRNLREQRNIKQQEIADLIGMHRSNYSKIENGQCKIYLNALERKSRFFNISMDKLVYIDGDLHKEGGRD